MIFYCRHKFIYYLIKVIYDRPQKVTDFSHLVMCFRITGAKGDKNIHATVSEQLKKNFAKSRWKVKFRFV